MRNYTSFEQTMNATWIGKELADVWLLICALGHIITSCSTNLPQPFPYLYMYTLYVITSVVAIYIHTVFCMRKYGVAI